MDQGGGPRHVHNLHHARRQCSNTRIRAPPSATSALRFLFSVLLRGTLAYATSIDISRLFTFSNFRGRGAECGRREPVVGFVFRWLMQGVHVTGFDASAHTAEENAMPREAPRGCPPCWSFLFGKS